jgi:hypothetical protein
MTGPADATRRHGLHVYVLFLSNLVAFIALAAIFLIIAGVIGLIQNVSNSFGGYGGGAGGATGTILSYGYAFLASLISLGAAWKMYKEESAPLMLMVVIVLQVVAIAVLHSWASLVPAIPAATAIVGLAVTRTPSGATGVQAIRGTMQSLQSSPQTTPGASYSYPANEAAWPPSTPGWQPAPAPQATRPQPPAQVAGSADTISISFGSCSNCGRENPPESRFCAGCGRALG